MSKAVEPASATKPSVRTEATMLKKLSVGTLFTFISIAGSAGATAKLFTPQDALVELRDNNCVNCHAKLSSPLRLTSRYAEWHMSTHKEKAVGCDKCHGGDPKVSDQKKTHAGVISPGDPKSRLHPQNLPETCNACPQGILSSFVTRN